MLVTFTISSGKISNYCKDPNKKVYGLVDDSKLKSITPENIVITLTQRRDTLKLTQRKLVRRKQNAMLRVREGSSFLTV